MPVLLMVFRMVCGWLILATIAGLISGFCNATLLAMINHNLNHPASTVWLSPGIALAC